MGSSAEVGRPPGAAAGFWRLADLEVELVVDDGRVERHSGKWRDGGRWTSGEAQAHVETSGSAECVKMRNGCRLVLLVMILGLGQVARATDGRLSEIDRSLVEIEEHAHSFPPHFTSKGQQAEVEQKLRDVIAVPDKVSIDYPDDSRILFREGVANAMGHNLDFPGADTKAMTAFDHLLDLEPNNRAGLYEYGGFLSGTALYKRAVPYLLRAIDLGENSARYALAFDYLKMGDSQNALVQFKAYLSYDPKNQTARKMVDDIEAGGTKSHVQVRQ